MISKIRHNKKTIMLFVCFLILMVIVFSRKVNFHVDELLSYNLSNGRDWFHPEDGVRYVTAEHPFVEYMANEGDINIKRVWLRQEGDVHPPLYYLCLHLVCRLFPNTISAWYGAVVNIFFQLITLAFVRGILKLLIEDEKIRDIILISYICCAGILSITTLIRMYAMVITIITGITYIHMSRKDEYRLRDFVAIYLFSVCGALTHYYFVAYVFFISAVAGVLLLIHKRLKETVGLCVSMGLAGVTAYLIFPAMIDHVFNSYRGTQSMNKLKSSDFFSQISLFVKILNRNLFGNMLLVFLIILLIGMVVLWIKGKSEDTEHRINLSQVELYMYLFIPVIAFILIISKSAVYNSSRYISPIYAVLFTGVISALYGVIKSSVENEKHRAVILAVILLIMTCSGFINARWEFLYLDSADRQAYAEENAPYKDAIIIYDASWRLVTSYKEIVECKSATYFCGNEYNSIDGLEESIANSDGIMFLLIQTDDEKFLADFEAAHPEYKLEADNGKFGYGTTYYYGKN